MRILTIILLFCGFGAFAQPIVYQGNANSITGFKGGVLADSGYYHPNIKGADTVLPGISTTGNGKEFSFTRTIFNRWVQTQISGSIPTWQQVLNAGSNLTGSNTINVGTQLRFDGPSLYFSVQNTFWDGEILVQDAPIEYLSDFSPFTDRQIPDAGWVNSQIASVPLLDTASLSNRINTNKQAIIDTASKIKTYINESSFDSTMSTTVSSLTSSRFARALSTINYAGLTYNSTYFTQVGTMITFIGLTFYNGQKLTFQLK